MIPNKIKQNFAIAKKRIVGSNTIVEGMLTCCNSQKFEVCIVGEIQHRLLSKSVLMPKNAHIALIACCRQCGRVIPVFDSHCDGYAQSDRNCPPFSIMRPWSCNICAHNDFSINVRYEYPDIEELTDLGITDVTNAFTWIWGTLVCNHCGTKYRNFIDVDTS